MTSARRQGKQMEEEVSFKTACPLLQAWVLQASSTSHSALHPQTTF